MLPHDPFRVPHGVFIRNQTTYPFSQVILRIALGDSQTILYIWAVVRRFEGEKIVWLSMSKSAICILIHIYINVCIYLYMYTCMKEGNVGKDEVRGKRSVGER